VIAARGLGRGFGAVLVTAGLGLSTVPVPAPAAFTGGPDAPGWPVLSDEDIRRQNETILLTVMAAVTQGLIR
jgi:hypothetical protein